MLRKIEKEYRDVQGEKMRSDKRKGRIRKDLKDEEICVEKAGTRMEMMYQRQDGEEEMEEKVRKRFEVEEMNIITLKMEEFKIKKEGDERNVNRSNREEESRRSNREYMRKEDEGNRWTTNIYAVRKKTEVGRKKE